MIDIKVGKEIKEKCPDFVGAAIYAKVENSIYNEDLWKAINEFDSEYRAQNSTEDIKKNLAVQATRLAYKKLGKDPNRYRPSSEALLRRIVRGLPLYQINTLVDIINLVSMKTGYSIGGFDVNKIQGDTLTLGVGMPDEPYEGIGRGILNIEGLPVYRDSIGGVGTPTSDNERTKIELDTTSFLALINGYSGLDGLQDAVTYMQFLLKKYANATEEIILYY